MDVYLSALGVSVYCPIILALGSHKLNEHFDSYIVASRPCRATVTDGDDMSSSGSSHTPPSYMNKPERKKRGEQRSKTDRRVEDFRV